MPLDAAIFGLIVADVIASPMDVRHPPPPGGLHLIDSITLTTGGNVCNVSLAMAKLGMKVAAAGLVGRDVLGAAVVESLSKGGVDTSAVFPTDKAQTSASVAAIEPGGERCFFHTPGATKLLDAQAFRRCFDVFKRCAYMQVGYFGLLPALTGDLGALLAELRRAAPDTKITLDTVNPPARWELLQPILPHLDLFAPSRTEAAALTGEKTPDRMVAAFRRHMKRGLIGIKLDAEGCYLDDGQGAVLCPAYKIKVVDTTGAGDTWFGGLITALRHNMPLEKAGRFANRAAADCCLALGASTGVKSFEDTLGRV
jgi:sugar/nucleoside kinase (ribokinase family)